MLAWVCSATRPGAPSSSCSPGARARSGELAEQLPISRPAVSQHLRVLKDGGLVVSQAEGTRRIYRLNPDGVAALRAYLDRVWDDALAAFQQGRRGGPDRLRTGGLMSSARTDPAICTGTVTVGVPVERAFGVFTGAFGHLVAARVPHRPGRHGRRQSWNPGRGGRWYERGVDGSECDWGRVLAWEPPHRLVLTWQINGQWQYDPDPAHASEIEVRFTADGPDQTTVELEHRLLDRLVGGQALHDGLQGGGGWTALLELFAKAAADQA